MATPQKFIKTNYTGIWEKDGKFFMTYWDIDGKSRRKWVRGAKTAKEAKRSLDEMKHQIADQRDGKVAMPIDKSVACDTLDILADRFFELRDTKGNEADKGRYKKWVSKKIGSNKHPITQLELEAYRKWLRNQSVSRGEEQMSIAPKTVNIIMGLIGSILKWGVGAKLVLYPNGIPSMKRLPIDNDRERVLSKDEIGRLLNELDTRDVPSHKRDVVRRNRLVILLGLYTGARPVSYLALRAKDIVLDDKGVPMRIKFSARKGAKAYEVPVAEKLKKDLEVALLDKGVDDVIINSSYSAIQQSLGFVFDRLFNKGVKGYDVRHKVSLYTLRHSSASLMLEATGDIYKVSKLLGHSSVVTTQRYAKHTDKALEDGINSF